MVINFKNDYEKYPLIYSHWIEHLHLICRINLNMKMYIGKLQIY